jgi:hypothetical protein
MVSENCGRVDRRRGNRKAATESWLACSYVAYRTRSVLPCFIIHFGMYLMVVFFVNH